MFKITIRGTTCKYRSMQHMVDALRNLDSDGEGRNLTEDERDLWNSLNEMIEDSDTRRGRCLLADPQRCPGAAEAEATRARTRPAAQPQSMVAVA